MAAQVAITKTAFQTNLSEVLQKDDNNCEVLVDVYKEVATCAENDTLVGEHIKQLHPDFNEHVEQSIADLKEVDRPILVIGETSAGKSSFLNLLIGRKVLPELTAPCTHCMCCIKMGRKLEARVSSFGGSLPSDDQIISGDGITDRDFQTKLEELVNEYNCEEALDRCIDIFVPSNMLEENVYLVDTPGFGESEHLTKSLVKFLPKAIGIIFILNATVSLGIADDRGVKILDEIKKLKTEGKIPSFDPSNILFIANKWDQVPEEERKKHRRKIIQKMEKVWPDFKEDQLLTLSVSYILKTEKSGLDPPDDYKSVTEDYQGVLKKIQATIHGCANARSRFHIRYLDKVLKRLETFLDASTAFSALSDEEKKSNIKILELIVSDMEFVYTKVEDVIKSVAVAVKDTIVKDVHQYLNDTANREEIFIWGTHNMPQARNYDAVQEQASFVIRSSIAQAVGTRLAQHEPGIDRLAKKIFEFTSKFKEHQDQLENLFKNIDFEETTQGIATNIDLPAELHSLEITKGEIVAIVVTSPLWFPLTIAGIFTVLPIAALVLQVKDGMKMRDYRKNKEEHHERWTTEILQTEYTSAALEHMLFVRLNDWMNKEKKSMEESITEYKNILKHLDLMQTEEVPSAYSQMRSLCCRMDGKLTTMQQS